MPEETETSQSHRDRVPAPPVRELVKFRSRLNNSSRRPHEVGGHFRPERYTEIVLDFGTRNAEGLTSSDLNHDVLNRVCKNIRMKKVGGGKVTFKIESIRLSATAKGRRSNKHAHSRRNGE